MHRPAFELALAVPWLMTESALSALLGFAARLPTLDRAAAAAAMHGPEALASRPGRAMDNARGAMTIRQGVAVISITGPIFRYADAFTRLSAACTTGQIAADVQTALDDPAVGAILFTIDSPGGEVTGINELADMIYRARAVKPSAAYIDGYGASAAYWLASAAGEVIVDDTAMVGSIGVIMTMLDPDFRKPDAPAKFEFVSSQSPNKRPHPGTERGRSQVQQLVDDLGAVFVAKVARNRGVSVKTVLASFGQGGLLLGKQAVDAGMADSLGSEESAIRSLATRAGKPGQRPAVRTPTPDQRQPPTETGRLLSRLRRDYAALGRRPR